MGEPDQTAYLNICIRYRIISVVLCTLVYLSPLTADANRWSGKIWIAFGMLSSCFLGIYLYRKTLGQGGERNLTRVVLGLELFAYGIFTFLSGGFASPYLWYYIGCLFIMMALQQCALVMVLGTAWCLLCAAANRLFLPQRILLASLELNLALGAAVIIGGFYILLHYIHRLVQNQEQQRLLNLRLEQEKERSEQALKHITNLYDMLNLFAMTDPYKVMEELGLILKRTVAPEGCVLVKLNLDGTVEKREIRDIEENRAEAVIDIALNRWDMEPAEAENPDWKDLGQQGAEERFEGIRIGGSHSIQGIFIRKKTGSGRRDKQQDEFYRGLIEIIFRNLDTQRQLEEYITAEEQNRLANEIHDTVIQKLFGLVCSLKILETNIGRMEEEDLKAKLRALKRSTELTMAELRQTIYGGRFESCDEDAFVGKLKLYMEEMERLNGVAIQLDIAGDTGSMTAAQKITIYRIACEAVNNAIRHGKARHMAIRIGLEEDAVRVEIEDDGTGFTKVQAAPLCGNGLKNMRRMTALLKGQFDLETEKGHGTRIKLSLPR